jgi:FkbM family methyltransferase
MKAAGVPVSKRIWRKVYWAWRHAIERRHPLDRLGGRWLLSAFATRRARSITQEPQLSIFYDEMWIDRVDDISVPRSWRFSYSASDLQRMKECLRARLDGSADYWTYLYTPKPGDIVFDIGAGVGVDAIVFSRLVSDEGRVYAFEAHPWTFRALQKSCALNRLSNVEPVHMAVADAKGTIWISDLNNDELNSVSKQSGEGFVIAVPAIDLDSFVSAAGVRHIALLKMNIEGAEELAILGMSKCITIVNNIVIACHDFRGDLPGTRGAVTEFLKTTGFDIVERLDDPREYVRDHIHGTRKAAHSAA